MQFDIGDELRRVRVSRKLSLRSVATAVGVSASLLSQVETGKTQPSVSTLYALVNHLGISLDGLMKGQAQSDLPADPSGYEDGHHGIVQRRNENPLIEMENGVVWERLADGGREGEGITGGGRRVGSQGESRPEQPAGVGGRAVSDGDGRAERRGSRPEVAVDD